MANFFKTLIICSVFLSSCGNKKESGSISNEKSTSENAYQGSDVNMSITDFDEASNKINGILNNGLDKSIRNIRGVFTFIDSAGNPITFANGTIKTSNFQKVANPEIAPAKSSVKIQFGNKVEKGTSRIDVAIIEVETADGQKIQLAE